MASLTSPLAGGLSPPPTPPPPPFSTRSQERRSAIAGGNLADSESEVDECSDLSVVDFYFLLKTELATVVRLDLELCYDHVGVFIRVGTA